MFSITPAQPTPEQVVDSCLQKMLSFTYLIYFYSVVAER